MLENNSELNTEYIHYVIATTRIPIMRKPNEEIEILSEFTTIEFEKINYLPEKPNYQVTSKYIEDKVNELCREIEEKTKKELEKEIENKMISNFKKSLINTTNKSENKTREPSPEFKIKKKTEQQNNEKKQQNQPKKDKNPLKELIKQEIYTTNIKKEKYSQEINNNLLNILEKHKKKPIS